MAKLIVAGTATSDKVLTGYSYSAGINYNEPGTMPNRSAENNHMPSSQYTVWAGDRVFLMPPAGYYDGGSWVTAQATDLRPENFRSDKNILGVQGTMPVRATGAHAATGITADGSGNLFFNPPAGYYESIASVYAYDTDFVGSNIRAGVNLFGVPGSLVEGKKFASGYFENAVSWSSMGVNGLTFTPRVIIIRTNGSSPRQFVYSPVASTSLNALGLQQTPDQSIVGNVTWTINADGFNVNFNSTQPIFVTYRWEAYGA